MSTLDEQPFIAIGEQILSLGQVLRYLQVSGKLLPLLQDIVLEHVVFQELQHRSELTISLAQLEQAAIDFRVQNQLLEPEVFQQWLQQQGIDHEMFQRRVALKLQLEHLKQTIAAPQLEQVFAERSASLAEVKVSCIALRQAALAVDLQAQLLADPDRFTEIVKAFTLEHIQETATLQQTLRCHQLPDPFHDLDLADACGKILGPWAVGDRTCLFRIEAYRPAVLVGAVQQELQEQLFQQWLVQQTSQLKIQFPVAESPAEAD
ncbi:MAG: hypothetical protein VKJ24_11365 [Synechococcales bacterium]|nr:hypothetical protein [Synechococcales bacterium]